MAGIYKKGEPIRRVFFDGKELEFVSFDVRKDKTLATGIHITVKTTSGEIIYDDGMRVKITIEDKFKE